MEGSHRGRSSGTGKHWDRRDSRTCRQLLAIILSQLVTAKDEVVTHPVATNPVKGQSGADATDDDFTVNL